MASMMDGLSMNKIFIILLIALFVLGPEKLPHYAQKLGELVRSVKRMADGAKDRLRDEMGPEYDDVDWKQLDPRQYDPRRIIRDALLEDEREAQAQAYAQTRMRGGATAAGGSVAAAAASSATQAADSATAPMTAAPAGPAAPNFDDEAT